MRLFNEKTNQLITLKFTKHLNDPRFLKNNENYRIPPEFNKDICKYLVKLIDTNKYMNQYVVLRMQYFEDEKINFLFKVEQNRFKLDLIDIILVSSIITHKLFPYSKIPLTNRIYEHNNYSFYIDMYNKEQTLQKEEQKEEQIKQIKRNKNLPGLKIIKKKESNAEKSIS